VEVEPKISSSNTSRPCTSVIYSSITPMNSRASSLGSSIVTSISRVSAFRFAPRQFAKGLTRGIHLYTRNSLFPPSTQPAKDTDKMSQTNLPLQGIFPIEKPTGPTSYVECPRRTMLWWILTALQDESP
jgi:hypothetical protein